MRFAIQNVSKQTRNRVNDCTDGEKKAKENGQKRGCMGCFLDEIDANFRKSCFPVFPQIASPFLFPDFLSFHIFTVLFRVCDDFVFPPDLEASWRAQGGGRAVGGGQVREVGAVLAEQGVRGEVGAKAAGGDDDRAVLLRQTTRSQGFRALE